VFPIKDNIPTDRLPVITIALIVINAFVYFAFQKGGIFHGPSDANVIKWGAIPYEITHPGKLCGDGSAVSGTGILTGPPSGHLACEGQVVQTSAGAVEVHGIAGSQPSTWVTIFTAMFMHGSILHLGGNMLFLWIFGNNVEDSMGYVKYVVFYILGGLAALGLQVLVDPSAAVPTVGASGAIAAVLGGYIVLYPRARVVTVVFIILFFTVLELPAVFMLGIWFIQQVLFGAYNLTDPTGGGGGVAYFAHIGGFAFGVALIKLFASRVKQVPPRIPVY
jgi:membrane associated rhomboid family serine protease